MKLSLLKTRCGKWLGGVFLVLALCLTAFSATALAETKQIFVDWPVAGEELPKVPTLAGTSTRTFQGWFDPGFDAYKHSDSIPLGINQKIDLQFSFTWTSSSLKESDIKQYDYKVTLRNTKYDVHKDFNISSSEVTVSGKNTDFRIPDIQPLVVLGEGNIEYGRDFTFTWGSGLKFKEGDAPNFDIELSYYTDPTIYSVGKIEYYQAGKRTAASRVASNMTGGEKYDLKLPIQLGERGVVDWNNLTGLLIEVPADVEYFRAVAEQSKRIVNIWVEGLPCVRTVDRLNVRGLTAPQIGNKPATTGITLATPDSNTKNPITIEADKVTWSGELDKYGNFKPDTHYTLNIDYLMNIDGILYSFEEFAKEKSTVNAGTIEDITGDGGSNGKITIGFDTPKEKFTVSFSAEGGSGTMDPITVTSGDKLTLPENGFTPPEGKEFERWLHGFPGEQVEITEETSIPAIWKFKTYTVTFDGNGHGTAPEAQTVTHGTAATEPTAPAESGWKFDGWYTEAACTNQYDFSKPIAADITLYAKWTQGFAVIFDANGGSGTMEPVTVMSGDKLTLPENGFTPPEGKEFDKWIAGNPGEQVEVTADSTIGAIWKNKTYTVTYDANGHGTAPVAQTVTSGAAATEPTAPAESGWKFDGWYTEAACTNKFDFSTVITGDMTLYAKWTQDTAETPSTEAPATDPARDAADISPANPAQAAAVENAILSTKSESDMKGSTFSLLQAKGVAKSKTSIKLTWTAVKGAAQYDIYGNKCGKSNAYEKITTVRGKTFTQKKLKKGTYYKYLIVAMNGDKVLAASKTIHVATNGGKVGNNTGVKLSKSKLTLKAGKSQTIKATLKTGSLKVKFHRKLAWESNDIRVAKVNAKGKITAVGKGTCFVYAYAQNGICAKIKVTVK